MLRDPFLGGGGGGFLTDLTRFTSTPWAEIHPEETPLSSPVYRVCKRLLLSCRLRARPHSALGI